MKHGKLLSETDITLNHSTVMHIDPENINSDQAMQQKSKFVFTRGKKFFASERKQKQKRRERLNTALYLKKRLK